MPTKPKKAAAGPSYADLIKSAIVALKERGGSSRQAINKFVSAKKGSRTAQKAHPPPAPQHRTNPGPQEHRPQQLMA